MRKSDVWCLVAGVCLTMMLSPFIMSGGDMVKRHLLPVKVTVEIGQSTIEQPPLTVTAPAVTIQAAPDDLIATIKEVPLVKKPVRFNGGQILRGDDHLLARYDVANDELVWETDIDIMTHSGPATGSESWIRLKNGKCIYEPTGSEIPDRQCLDKVGSMMDSPIGPGATDCELYQLRIGQWGWVGNGFLVPTSHGIVPDSSAHVWDHPTNEQQSQVLMDADGVLNVYLERRLERQPYRDPPFSRELGVRVHWLD